MTPPILLTWSVVRGASPGARAVDPGQASVTIPTLIIEWAEQHGLNEKDDTVYLLVTLENESGHIDGEIAYMSYPAGPGDVDRIKTALAYQEEAARSDRAARGR